MGMEKYETVVDLARQGANAALYLGLRDRGPELRIELLRLVFREYANAHLDEEAHKNLTYIAKALEDKFMLPLTVTKLDGLSIERWPYSGEDRAKVREAKEALAAARFEEAKCLWHIIPPERLKNGKYGDTEKHPTMLKTKREILAVVVRLWGEVEGEETAADCLGFLAGLSFRFGEDKDVLLDALRKETGSGFPRSRIFAGIRSFDRSSPSSHSMDVRATAIQILALAWVRNHHPMAKTDRLVRELGLLAPLEQASEPGIDFLADFTAKFAAFDQAVQELVGVLKTATGHFVSARNATYSYPKEGGVRIQVTRNFGAWEGAEKGNDDFADVRYAVNAWKKKHPDYAGTLLYQANSVGTRQSPEWKIEFPIKF